MTNESMIGRNDILLQPLSEISIHRESLESKFGLTPLKPHFRGVTIDRTHFPDALERLLDQLLGRTIQYVQAAQPHISDHYHPLQADAISEVTHLRDHHE